MWPGFEEAFEGFDIGRCMTFNDDDLSRLVSDTRIVRNGQKIRAVIQNASFIGALTARYGGAGKFFGEWPADDYVGLLTLISPLKKALLTGFHSTAKHNATKAVSPSSETMRTI